MTHSPTRIAAAALLGASAMCLVALPTPAEAALPLVGVASSLGHVTVPASAPAAAPSYAIPLKNTTYKAKVTDSATGIKINATVKVGAVTKVTKLVIKLSCAGGKNKLVRKNLVIDEYGSFYSSTASVEQVTGQWRSKHKLEGDVYADESKPCGGYNVDYVAKD